MSQASDDDDIDAWLAAELAPPARVADLAFVTATLRLVDGQAAFRATRRRLVADAAAQVAALAALVAGLIVLSRVPALAQFQHVSAGLLAPPLILVVLLWAFASGLFDPLREPG
jgi:hypothetical protein